MKGSMMNSVDNGGPAFPVPDYVSANNEAYTSLNEGMSLRDYFAGLAMQSLISIGASKVHDEGRQNGDTFEWPDQPYYFGEDIASDRLALASDSYDLADAMLKARKE